MSTHRTARAAPGVGLLIAALLAGCGGSSDALERQLAGLRAELVKVRADHAVLTERLEALERAGAARPEAASAAAAAPRRASPSDRPALEVVRLVPAPDEAPPPAAGAPPPPAAGAEPADPQGPTELAELAEGPRPVLRSTRDGGVVADEPGGPGAPTRASRPPGRPAPASPRSTPAPKRTP